MNRAYLRQGKGAASADHYVGRCWSCRTKFMWPKTPATKGVIVTSGGVQFDCPVCDCRRGVIQTSRMGAHGEATDFHLLYEHQVTNLQAASR